MAGPAIAEILEGGTTSGTSHTPDIGSMTLGAGDLLVMIIQTGAIRSWNTHATWTRLFGSGGLGVYVYEWEAAGDTTPTFTHTGLAATPAWQCLRFAAADGPGYIASTGTTGGSGSPDPDTVSGLSAGTDYTAIAIAGADDEAPSAGPTGYSSFNAHTNNGTAAHAVKQLTGVTSENPGTFTMTSSSWAAMTLAVYTSSVDGTATPATVNVVAAVPAPTLSTVTTTSPATVNIVAAVPAPDAFSAETVTPATVNAVAAIPAPTLSAGSGTSPATVNAVAAIPSANAISLIIVTPATVNVVVGIPSASAANLIVVIEYSLLAPRTVNFDRDAFRTIGHTMRAGRTINWDLET